MKTKTLLSVALFAIILSAISTTIPAQPQVKRTIGKKLIRLKNPAF